jgi:hypothetical protein
MSKETLVFVIGFLVLVSPFLGVPRNYKDWICIISGGMLMIIGYLLRRYAFLKSIEQAGGERRADAFVENTMPSAVQATSKLTSKIPSQKDSSLEV